MSKGGGLAVEAALVMYQVSRESQGE